MVTLNQDCDLHGWTWASDDAYGCPVCKGISLEREHVTETLTQAVEACANTEVCAYCDALTDLIYTINEKEEEDNELV